MEAPDRGSLSAGSLAEQTAHVLDRIVAAGERVGLVHAALKALASLRMEKIAGKRYPATMSLRPLFDPENRKFK